MISPIILYEDNDLVCVVKPAGMPTQPDKTGDIKRRKIHILD